MSEPRGFVPSAQSKLSHPFLMQQSQPHVPRNVLSLLLDRSGILLQMPSMFRNSLSPYRTFQMLVTGPARKLSLCVCGLSVGLLGCGETEDAPQSGVRSAPAHTIQIDSPSDDPTAKNVDQPDSRGQQTRNKSLAVLKAAGFNFSSNLPTSGHRAAVPAKLRPIRDVALRLMALDVLFAWVAMPDSDVATELLQDHIQKNNLTAHMTASERSIVQLSRSEANQQHVGSIGWHLENMWALAWILGFDPSPEATSGQIPGEISRAMVLEFLPEHGTRVEDFLAGIKPRPEQQIIELEDLLYCAHNAVRSAQMGSESAVPEGFHPVSDGGAIHERRHSLTWAISPDVDWDDTDLST